MSHVLHRHLGQEMPRAAVGIGSTISPEESFEDEVFDLSSGAGVLCLGYSCISVKMAMHKQAMNLPYVHAAQWTTDKAEELADRLIELAAFPDGGGAVMFLNGGGEAIEAACKLAMQYFAEVGRREKPHYFAREHSYHGNSLFCLRLGDHPRARDYHGMLPLLAVTRLPVFQPRRVGVDHADEYRNGCVARLEDGLAQCYATGRPAIVVIEPIGGTTLGVEPSDADYLAYVRALCDRYGAILIYDEVLCGNYRTGRMYAWQYYQDQTTRNLAPDIIVAGKGLTAGYFPLSAVIANARIVSGMAAHSGRLWHSTTNQNHPLGCAAALAALNEYASRSTHSQKMIEDVMLSRRTDLVRAPLVERVDGVGALWGLHLDPHLLGLHLRVKEALFKHKIACYTDGSTGNNILIAPAYGSAPSLDKVIDGVIEVLGKVHATL